MKHIAILTLCVALVQPLFALDAVRTRTGNLMYGSATVSDGEVTLVHESGRSETFKKDDVEVMKDFELPVPKKVARVGNFEIFGGTSVPGPIDMERFRSGMLRSLASHGWKVEEEKPGEMYVKLEKSSYLWVTIRICYTPSEYWYEYLDSENLDANPKRNTIHRNYARWIAILEKEMAARNY